jgi:hypothetical protein
LKNFAHQLRHGQPVGLAVGAVEVRLLLVSAEHKDENGFIFK